MTRTDLKTPPANPHKHDHGLTAIDRALAALAARVAALEAASATHALAGHTHVVVPPPVVPPTPEPPPVVPPPEPPPVIPPLKSVAVSSVAALKTALIDDTVDEIVVANGTYVVAPAQGQAATSLWMGSAHASRTRPITVRAQTTGGVTFSGNGSQAWGGISFQQGAHHQTWDGFKFADGRPKETGVIMFGGYGYAGAHHITLRNITMLPSITGPAATNQDHCIYFSSDEWHDVLIEDYTATPGANIQSALQFHHDPNGYGLTVRRMHVTGTQSTILLYTPTLHDVLIEDSDITNARDAALNVYQCGANVVLRNVTSNGGVYFVSGQPTGLSLINCSFA